MMDRVSSKMTWTYLPPGLDDFFAAIGRPRRPGEPAPEPFERPADVHPSRSQDWLRPADRGLNWPIPG
jgi:hypothetical protein